MQRLRYNYTPQIPDILKQPSSKIKINIGKKVKPQSNEKEIAEIFPYTYGAPTVEFIKGKSIIDTKPKRFGVILSGGQAPGGHNVIAGLFDSLKKDNPASKLYGFLSGPQGLINGQYIELKQKRIDEYRNTGGFDIIGSGRTKVETDEQVAKSIEVVRKLKLDALIVIGGDDSNTNAAFLAKYFLAANLPTKVIGVPKTIDGDLKNEYIETSFGFDTATKLYSELIGNICRDVNSAHQYWHFIKLMGRSASHITLECALKTQPNVCLISEEVAAKKMTLSEICNSIADIVLQRAKKGVEYGIVLIPEGVIEFIPEMKSLIGEINDLMGLHASTFEQLSTALERREWLSKKLSEPSHKLFHSLPDSIASQLVMDRDPHGNVQVSRIESEKLFIHFVTKRVAELTKPGIFKKGFVPMAHFFGYEGRSAFPSNFDSDYCYTLGITSYLLALHGYTGYIATVQNLTDERKYWKPCGIPLAAMMNMERRKGKLVPVIKKALVDLNGKPFKEFAKKRDSWAINTVYRFPGAIQYFGDLEVCNIPTKMLLLERGNLKEKRSREKTKNTTTKK